MCPNQEARGKSGRAYSQLRSTMASKVDDEAIVATSVFSMRVKDEDEEEQKQSDGS